MKKNFKRKNYVLIGAIGIAAVALTSVGFATWITGIQQKTDTTNDISVSVDAVNNKTSYIEVAVDQAETIKIGEASTVSNQNGVMNVESPIDADLEVTFTTFKVITDTNFRISNIGISLAIYEGDNFSSKVLVDSTNGIYAKTINGTSNESTKSTYITLNKTTIATSELTKLTEGAGHVKGYNCYKLTNMNLKFSWGSLFGNVEPSTHYGSFTENSSFEDRLAKVQQATAELTEMYSNLNGSKMKITFTLNGDYSSQS